MIWKYEAYEDPLYFFVEVFELLRKRPWPTYAEGRWFVIGGNFYAALRNKYLTQDRVWTDSKGRTWTIEGMDPTHRKNLLRWLWVRAEKLQPFWSEDAIKWLERTPFVKKLVSLEGGY